jgi:dGTPase
VSSVGRTLGTLAGTKLVKKYDLGNQFSPQDFGAIVAAACLAHDIGNPPLGHAGEDAIAKAFDDAPELLRGCSESESTELKKFEGNAQGFRIIARNAVTGQWGMQLTHATLAAFTKYPHTASAHLPNREGVSTKKFNFFSSELPQFRRVAEGTGLLPVGDSGHAWARHPLAFLVEAADDICNGILDLEDGARLGFIDKNTACDALRNIAKRRKWYNGAVGDGENIEYLRATAIDALVREALAAFLEKEELILTGEFDREIISIIPSNSDLRAIRTLSAMHCYTRPEVLEIEAAGYEVLGGLTKEFALALLASNPSGKRKKLVNLFPHNRRPKDTDTPFEKILAVTDYVSGMTDRFAMLSYQRLHGIALPLRTR